MINYKLDVCRITVASRMLATNNYFPLFRIMTPADAARELALKSGVQGFRPKNHYMPVLLSSARRKRRPPGTRPHTRLEGHDYLCLRIEAGKHARLVALLEARPQRLRGFYVYRVPDRDTCLVLDARLEQAARVGDIADLTIADHADRLMVTLRGGDRMPADAVIYSPEKGQKLYEGEAGTTKEHETKHHHYGRSTMTIAHIFETMERSAALKELERLQHEAKRRQRAEREWKDGLASLAANLKPSTKHHEPPPEGPLATGLHVTDMTTTLDVSSRLSTSEQVHRLPHIGQLNTLVSQHMATGSYTVLAETTGLLVTINNTELFIVGQEVEISGERVFVPGQTFHTATGMYYMPGLTVNLDNAPTFVAGVVFADDKGTPVFLPGQALISHDGTMTLPGQPVTPHGMSKLHVPEEELRPRVLHCRAERRRLHKENKRRAAVVTVDKQGVSVPPPSDTLSECLSSNSGVDSFSETQNPTMELSDTMKLYEEEISHGTFLREHESYLVPELTIEKDEDVQRARSLLEQRDEDRLKHSRAADDMRDVIDALEQKKVQLLEKLRNIQNETVGVEERSVTYIFPAKAHALAAELGFEGRQARDLARVLLGVTRWAAGYSARFHVHQENVAPSPSEVLAEPPDQGPDGQRLGCELRTCLRAAMAAAVQVFRERPRDLEAGMRAAGLQFAHCVALSERPERLVQQMSAAVQSRTNTERNEMFSETLRDLTQRIVVNKADTLRSVIREQFDQRAVVSKVALVIEDEGDILVRAYSNLAIDNEPLARAVHSAVLGEGMEDGEDGAARTAHRAVVHAVQEVYERELGSWLRAASAHAVGHLLLEARSLAQLVGMHSEAGTLERLLVEDDCVGLRVQAADQVTLAIVRRALVMRRLAERNPQLAAGLAALRRAASQQRCPPANEPGVRELVLQSAALTSQACPVLNSLDIPSFLFELSGSSMALEDFLVRRVKRGGALLISRAGVQAVVPREASRFVLAGLVDYTLIDDRGISHFRPMHVFSALRLDKGRERRYHDYSCVGAFDRYACSVPVREYADPDVANRYLDMDNPCSSQVSVLANAALYPDRWTAGQVWPTRQSLPGRQRANILESSAKAQCYAVSHSDKCF